jgi:T4 bacteriophage base plate protein
MRSEQLPDTYTLPGGLVLEEGRRLGQAALRPLTGREEEWLAKHPRAPSAAVTTRLLSNCLVWLDDAKITSDLIRQLLVGDRDYLMLQLRRITLGDEFQAVFTCPACSAKMNTNFDTSEVPIESHPQTAASYTLELREPQPAGRTVRFRLPTGSDQEALFGMDPADGVGTLLNRCLLDDGGAPLLPEEQQSVIEAMERVAPRVELELDLTCPECRQSFVAPFDTTSFFFDEMRINAGRLLGEVHALAFYYHWSEADILQLQRDRRRAYLALLSDTLRQK